MTPSGLRHARAFFGYGLLAMALFWAYGQAVASRKSTLSEAQLVHTTQTPSTTTDTSCEDSGTFDTDTLDAETLMAARKTVYKQSADIDEEFRALDQLGLL